MEQLRIVVLVSKDISDIYFANQMLKHLHVVGVVVEQQGQTGRVAFTTRCLNGLKYLFPPRKLFHKIHSESVLNEYHALARRVGQQHFGLDGESLRNLTDDCEVLNAVGAGSVNDQATIEFITDLRPDLLVVCGCSILTEKVLAIPKLGALNLHGGLSQWYRGIWTTMWAIYNGEPEYVGATVHYIAAGIDDGDIVFQGRPELDSDDNTETLYAKVVKLGVKMMIAAVERIQDGSVVRYSLPEKGRLYLEKLVTADVLQRAVANINNCVVNDYLQHKQQRDASVIAAMCGVFSGLENG